MPDYLQNDNVGIAMDFMSISFNDLHRLPKLIPVLRVLFRDELFELQLLIEKKTFGQNGVGENPIAHDKNAEGSTTKSYGKRKRITN